MEEPRPYTFDRVVRIVIFIAILIGAFFLLELLKSVLLPFFVAWLMAYLMHPLVSFFQKKCRIKNRVIAVIITLLAIVAAMIGIAAVIFPMIMDEIRKASIMFGEYMADAESFNLLPAGWEEYLRSRMNWHNISTYLNINDIRSIVETAFSGGWTILSGTVTFLITLFGWFIVLLYLVFILVDYDKIQRGFRDLIPGRHKETIIGIIDDVECSMNTYFRGQALVAFCVGILFSIGFSIVGLPLAILLGLFIGLLNLVPYLQLIGFFPAIMLTLLQSAETGENFWWIFMWVLVVFSVVQLIQDLILVPKIMGKAIGLNPAVILLSLSVWGVLLGFIGLIIALPLTSLCISYYHKYVLKN
ncbi:MAG: AI-2E family transporter [Bacteroidales bacterium]